MKILIKSYLKFSSDTWQNINFTQSCVFIPNTFQYGINKNTRENIFRNVAQYLHFQLY
jgi:hypothetical protein